MRQFRIVDKADLSIFYEADASNFVGGRATVLETVTVDVFFDHYRKCQSIGFEYDGKPIGGMIFDRGYAHLAVLPSYHGRWAILWEHALEWLFRIAPEVLAVVETDNSVCIEFMRRNGWPVLSVSDSKTTFRMTPQARALGIRGAR